MQFVDNALSTRPPGGYSVGNERVMGGSDFRGDDLEGTGEMEYKLHK
ncbi:MAG: hypothetical protein R6T89_07515 [Candidatus Syntrophosphaera sp.]